MQAILFVTGFLLVFLVIGLRQANAITTFEQFALSRGQFGEFTLTCTIVASFVGGGAVIGTIEKAYASGFYPLFALTGFILQLLLVAVIFPRALPQLGQVVTLGDVLSTYYGEWARKLVSLLWLVFSFGVLAVQMKAMGEIVHGVSQLNLVLGVLVGGGVVVAYCMLGGIRAVIYTDVIQFVAMFLVLPLSLYYLISHVVGIDAFAETALYALYQQPKSWDKVALLSAFIGFLGGDAFIPPVIQRVLVARNVRQLQRTYNLGAVGALMIITVATLIGIALSNIASSTDVGVMTLFFATLQGWMKILAMLGLFAVVISSADTYLNATTVVVVKDLLNTQSLKLCRSVTVLIGVVEILVALLVPNLFDILLFVYKFWGPIVVVPVLVLLLGKPMAMPWFKLSVVLSSVTVLLWNVFQLQVLIQVSDVVAGICVSGLVCLLSSFLELPG